MDAQTLIIFDSGHGVNTPGKRSPNWQNGVYYEGRGNRVITAHCIELCQPAGIRAVVLVPENEDIPLGERVRRIKELGKQNKGNVIVLSNHSDAFTDPRAAGWSAWTTKGQTASDEMIPYLYAAAERHFPGRKMRSDFSDKDKDFEASFRIVKEHPYKAVLLEHFFMTNRDDYLLLTDVSGPRRIAAMVVDALVDYRNYSQSLKNPEIEKKVVTSDVDNSE